MRKGNIDFATDARHNWLQAIIDKESHEVISRKWESYVVLVRTTGYSMYDFEEMLKNTNKVEWDFAIQAGAKP